MGRSNRAAILILTVALLLITPALAYANGVTSTPTLTPTATATVITDDQIVDTFSTKAPATDGDENHGWWVSWIAKGFQGIVASLGDAFENLTHGQAVSAFARSDKGKQEKEQNRERNRERNGDDDEQSTAAASTPTATSATDSTATPTATPTATSDGAVHPGRGRGNHNGWASEEDDAAPTAAPTATSEESQSGVSGESTATPTSTTPAHPGNGQQNREHGRGARD